MEDKEFLCGLHNNGTNSSEIILLQENLPSLIFLGLCFLIGLVGNISVVVVYYRNFRPSNYRIYVLFLATIDTIFCLTTLPFYILNVVFQFGFVWNAVCRVGCFVTIFLSLASLILLIIVAFDRYIAIRNPFRPKLSQEHAFKGCIAALVLSVTISWYSLLLYGVEEEVIESKTVSKCSAVHKLANMNSYILVSCSILLSSFFAIIYLGIWVKIKASARRLSKGYKNRMKTVVIYIAITAVFSFTTILTLSLYIVRKHYDRWFKCHLGTPEVSVLMLLSFAHCLNHVSNPVIYYWRDLKFRTGLQRICFWWYTLEVSQSVEKDSSRSTSKNVESVPLENV